MRNAGRTFVFLLLLLLAGCGGKDEKDVETPAPVPATESPPPSPLVIPSPLPSPTPLSLRFDGERALQHAARQMDFGDRPTGSPGGKATGDYIIAQLEAAGWEAEEQTFDYQGVQARNIIGGHHLYDITNCCA